MYAESAVARRGLPQRLAALGRPDARFLRRLAITGVGNGLSRALGLLLALVLAAIFLPADYGYIRWATSVGMLAAIPVAGGPVALARALGAAQGDLGRQRGLATVGVAAIVAVTAACAVATAVVLAALERPVGGALAVLVGMTLFTVAYNTYRGLGSAWRIAALYAGSNALQLLLVVLLCGALGWKIPDLALIIYSFAWTLVVITLELRAPLGLSWDLAAARGALAELWRVWAPLVLANAAYAAWAWGDVVLVERFLGDAAAGYYGLARTIVTVFLLVPEAVTMLLLPLVAAEGRGAGKLMGSLLGLTAAVSVVLLGGVLFVAPPLLHALGDGRYAPATAALPGLAVGMALYALYMVLEGHLVGMGRAAVHAAGIAVMFVVTLGGVALLLPSQGLAGGGLAFALGAAAGLATLVALGRGALRGAPPPPPNPGDSDPRPRIAMVSSTYYVADPRIRRQAEALVAHGYAIDVICQRQPNEAPVEDVAGVRVYRVGGVRYRGRSLLQYARVYGGFFLAALVQLTRLQRRHGYAAVQVYSMPEALIFTAIAPKLAGVPLIYDAGDLTTDLYAAKLGDRALPLLAGALRLQERVCLPLADLVVTVHEPYRQRIIARGVPPERVVVVMNLPDERLFHPGLRATPGALPPGFERPPDGPQPFILVNHGSWVERYGIDLSIEAVGLLRDRIPELRLLVYGDGDLRPRLTALVERLGLRDRVYLAPHYLPVERMPGLLAAADAGIVPSRSDAFTETMLPNKLLEYLALGLPTIVTRTRTVVAHVPDSVVEYCAPGDAADLARIIERVWSEAGRRQALTRAALDFSAAHRWSDAAARYAAAVDALVARHGRAPAAPVERALAESARRAR